MDVEAEVTLTETVTCPHCKEQIEVSLTDMVTIEVEPDDSWADLD